jgi:thermostable 8-oxoguanine DNA glycosylase
MKNLSQNGWPQESNDSWLTKIQETYKTKLENTPFDKLGKEKKRQRVFSEQNFCCNSCKLSTWMNKPIPLELEHKDGDTTNNVRENLEGLCRIVMHRHRHIRIRIVLKAHFILMRRL